MSKKKNILDNLNDFRALFYRISINWYYFVLSIIFCLIVSFTYTRYSTELFSSSIKIQIDKNNSTLDLLDLNLDNDKYNRSLSDEIQLLKRYEVVRKTVSDLRFDVRYSVVGTIKTTETYHAPILVDVDTSVTQNNPPINFEITIVDDSISLFSSEYAAKSKYAFGELISFGPYQFRVWKNLKYKSDNTVPTIVNFSNFKKITLKYQSLLELSSISSKKETNTLLVSINQQDQVKGSIFLNKLIENYISLDIIYRQEGHFRAVSFLESKIKSTEDSLTIDERRLQDFQNSNVIDLDKKTEKVYDRIYNLESEYDKYSEQNRFYSSIERGINNGEPLISLITNPTMESVNPKISNWLELMVKIDSERNLLISSGLVDNPSIAKFEIQIKELSDLIFDAIQNHKYHNNMLLDEIKRKIDQEELYLGALPVEQRELKSIERVLRTKESHYVYLLNKSAEAMYAAKSVVSNIRIVEKSNYFTKKRVSPNTSLSYGLALLIGGLIPIIVFFILDFFNNKIRSRFDIEKYTDIDIIGTISRNHSGNNIITSLNPKSIIAEGFRSLRSNLNYYQGDNNHKIYLVTSSVSGEGKTFLASNLSIVFANSNKQTLLLSADLRKPRVYQDFQADNSLGLSTFLRGDSKIDDIIVKTDVENLDAIFAGPLPTNPSDLFVSNNFDILMKKLKNKYDKIIIDTAPIGLVADASMVLKYSDVNLYVVRQNYTDKNVLDFMNDLKYTNNLKNLKIVLNDMSAGVGVYGYGRYSYGYGYGYGGYGYGTYVTDSDYFEEEK